MHTRPLIFEEPYPPYVAEMKRRQIAYKAAFCYQPGDLTSTDLPPQPSLAEQYKDEL
jgi:hypothetical protein